VVLAGGVALGLVAGAILYTRLQRERALEQGTRKRVYGAICQEPGVRVGTLATRLGLDHNTVLYHARVLQSFQLVKAIDGAGRRYMPMGALSPEEEAQLSKDLVGGSPKAIYEHLNMRGPSGISSLAHALGLAYSTVAAIVNTLEKQGLVDRERIGRRWVVRAVPAGGQHTTPLGDVTPLRRATNRPIRRSST